MIDFKNKPYKSLAIILGTVVLLNILGTKAFDLLMPKQSQTIVYKWIDESVEKSLSKHLDQIFNSDLEYPVTLLGLEFGTYKTAKEVEERVNFLKENSWNAQIAAMKVIAGNDYAKALLESKLYDPKFVKIIIQGFE